MKDHDFLYYFEKVSETFPNLAHLTTLENGWLDGEGLAPNKEVLLWLAKNLKENLIWHGSVISLQDLSDPYCYPTFEGNVSLEWYSKKFDISLLIDMKTLICYFSFVNVKDEDKDESDQEGEFSLTSKSDWVLFNSRLEVLLNL